MCSPEVQTGNTVDAFNDTVLLFSDDQSNAYWSKDYAPYCYNDTDGNRTCSEYRDVPDEVNCDAEPPEGYQRLCLCITAGTFFYSLRQRAEHI